MSSPFTEAYRRGEAFAENLGAFAIRDAHPLSRGHSLICPRREVASMDELEGWPDFGWLWDLALSVKRDLMATTPAPTGFRFMVNEGLASEGGPQHIAHLHIHVIPWYPHMKP
jgi:diadenosine tetraphosphate (Ap4A) HIT family hydrolase